MKFTVYHTTEFTSLFVKERPAFPQDYKKVAVVECEDLEDVFRATNHIHDSWVKNPEVKELVEANPRSTSVHDVVVDEDGCRNYCAPVGWEVL